MGKNPRSQAETKNQIHVQGTGLGVGLEQGGPQRWKTGKETIQPAGPLILSCILPKTNVNNEKCLLICVVFVSTECFAEK